MEMLTSLYLYSKYLKNNTELQIFEDFCENGKYKQSALIDDEEEDLVVA